MYVSQKIRPRCDRTMVVQSRTWRKYEMDRGGRMAEAI